MLPSQRECIEHILEEIDYCLRVTSSISKEFFFKDETLKRATTRSLEIIGEAARYMDSDFKQENNYIEWRLMQDMRNKIIHEYFGVNYEVVWDTIRNDLVLLKEQLLPLLE
jgi:uncharacterized protein with HEPN domain